MEINSGNREIQIIYRKPTELKNHLLSIKLYGDHIDKSFLEYIGTYGIRTPLTIIKSSDQSLNDTVVMGRRRRMAAVMFNIQTVPCVVWECGDPLEIEKALILDNVRNETTVEERTRMYAELKRIEASLAERRMKATLKQGDSPARVNLAERENIGENRKNGRAGDIAAAQVGMCRTTAEKALCVVESADQLALDGKTQQATAVIFTLNTQSVAAAMRKVQATTNPPVADAEGSLREIDKHTAAISRDYDRLWKSTVEMMKALDRERKTSRFVQQWHPKFENLLRSLGEELEPVKRRVREIETQWKRGRRRETNNVPATRTNGD